MSCILPSTGIRDEDEDGLLPGLWETSMGSDPLGLLLRGRQAAPPCIADLQADCIRDSSHSDFLATAYLEKFTFANYGGLMC